MKNCFVNNVKYEKNARTEQETLYIDYTDFYAIHSFARYKIILLVL